MSVSPSERLDPDDVHVWTVDPATITDSALLAAYENLESADERRRRSRLYFARHRHERLVSVALVRTTLSRYADVSPASWSFRRNPWGRPDLVPGQCEPPLRFNLSHTEGLVACAVTLDRAIGVDVESVERQGKTVEIAERYFAPAEVRELRSRPEASQRLRFFEYWTLKESYIKARGLGLRIPLRRFAFRLDGAGGIAVAFDEGIDDDPATWQFGLFRPTSRHVLAVGVRKRDGRPAAVSVRGVVPPG